MKWIICAAFFWLGWVSTLVGDNSPVGTWKTVDDETGRPKSIVRITEQDGELSGKVLQVLESPQGPHRFVDDAKASGKINRSKA